VNVARACLTAALCLALVPPASSVAVAEDAPETSQPHTAVARVQPEHVLMIGNSHIARLGGLDWLLESFVAAEGSSREFDAEAITKGGVTLAYHWQNGAPDRIRSGEFDAVVLQGWLSGEETQTIEPFIEHARLLDSVVREAGAETVFLMTWPRAVGDWSDLDDAIEAHRTIAAELGARVAPAAIAFDLAQAERPDLALIGEDHVHATWEGTYLAAATVYATLFGRSPEGLRYYFVGVDPDDAAFLQRVAWQAVTEWQALTETDTLVASAD
jgi:hypothetical protein